MFIICEYIYTYVVCKDVWNKVVRAGPILKNLRPKVRTLNETIFFSYFLLVYLFLFLFFLYCIIIFLCKLYYNSNINTYMSLCHQLFMAFIYIYIWDLSIFELRGLLTIYLFCYEAFCKPFKISKFCGSKVTALLAFSWSRHWVWDNHYL